MKRALAERAKQSETSTGPQHAPHPPPVVSSSSSGEPPGKLPRLEEKPMRRQVKVEAQAPATIASPSPRPTSVTSSTSKRRRSSVQEEEDEGDNSSAFFLKHQNQALASELKGLQYQLRLLEKERDVRRKQCQEATEALKALQATWTQMELGLQLGTPPQPPAEPPGAPSASEPNDGSTTRNTGSGDSVELIGGLLDSLASLGNGTTATEEDEDDDDYKDLRDMKRVASLVSKRAQTLHDWIWTLLQRVNGPERLEAITQNAKLESKVVTLQQTCRELEARIAELATTRDEAVESDRRVRRGLYRLSAGRMDIEQVLKAVEDDDKDGVAAAMALQVANEVPAAVAAVTAVAPDGDEEAVDGAQVLQLKKQLQDIEEVAASRESQIEQLLQEREESLKRINDLSLPKETSTSVSVEDIKRSSLFTETATRLITTERQLDEVRTQLAKTMEKYAAAKGDAELASKTLEEHMDKFQKRWEELTANSDEENGKETPLTDTVAQAKRIVELEHKLKQALENVRQADSVRVSLDEALKMNETLQQKLEEFKGKNALLMAGKSASRSTSESALASTKEKSSSAPVTSEKSEKMHRENRRMRKELAAALASKESAKAKQERAEKERDNLMKTNSRLLKQSTEKDDMNAKSLSTILHLKHMTEQYEHEKALLEQEAKSAGQLALAARLATNAKERVAEEALKEKQALEDRVGELEKECESLKRAKEVADGALSQTKAEMSSLEQSVSSVKNRCEELAAESTKLQEEKRTLTEAAAVARREASEAMTKLADFKRSTGGGGGQSEFTAEELSTHLKILKGKLDCPVCNSREKSCILLRCRHMFCKPCVEENIKNRSRKCPACGGRFDNKDVCDIWF